MSNVKSFYKRFLFFDRLVFHNFCSLEDIIIYIVPAKKCLDYLFNLLPNVHFFILFITPSSYVHCVIKGHISWHPFNDGFSWYCCTLVCTQNNTLSMMRVQTKQIFKMMIYAFFHFHSCENRIA